MPKSKPTFAQNAPKKKSASDAPAYLEVYIKNDGTVLATPVTLKTKKVIESFSRNKAGQPLNAYCG